MHENIVVCINFLGFWKFPETAWREMNVRQAIHLCQVDSGLLGEESPSGKVSAAKRCIAEQCFWAFPYALSGGDE